MFKTLVVDDFLMPREQKILEANLLSRAKWMFLEDMSYSKNNPNPSYGFVHVFKHPDQGIMSEFYNALVQMFLPKFEETLNTKIESIHYTRSFLQVPLAPEFVKSHNGIHVDLPIPHIACVYYVNDSDGDTIIYNNLYGDNIENVALIENQRVTPKAGRAVFFDGSRYHCSSQPTKRHRCIINFDLLV